jgi:hypothetical protein
VDDRCPVDITGWCARHQRIHAGSELALCQEISARADRYRRILDERVTNRPAPSARPSPQVRPSEPVAGGLGDTVESALKAVGITKERVERWLGAPCGCAERREKLNRIGSWAMRMLTGKATAEEGQAIVG